MGVSTSCGELIPMGGRDWSWRTVCLQKGLVLNTRKVLVRLGDSVITGSTKMVDMIGCELVNM